MVVRPFGQFPRRPVGSSTASSLVIVAWLAQFRAKESIGAQSRDVGHARRRVACDLSYEESSDESPPSKKGGAAAAVLLAVAIGQVGIATRTHIPTVEWVEPAWSFT